MPKTGSSCIIYALCDSRKRGAKRVFYIGKANNAQTRLARHVRDAKSKSVKTKKDALIVELDALGKGPHLLVLEFVDGCKGWEEREWWWMREYERRGATLLNIATGGANDPRSRRRWLVRRRIKRLTLKRKDNAENE